MSQDTVQGLDVVVDRFRTACADGVNPSIGEYLAGIDAADRCELLVSLGRIVLETQTARNEEPRIEPILEFADNDADRREAAERLVADECRLRVQAGEAIHERDILDRLGFSPDVPPLRTESASTAADDPPLDAGSEIAGYRIERQIGTGGASEVFLAADNESGQRVALKVSQDVTKEADVLRQLDHPNVISVFDIVDFGRRQILVMQYIDGVPLSNLLETIHGRSRHGLRLSDALSESSDSPADSDSRRQFEAQWVAAANDRPVDFSCLVIRGVADALEHAHASGISHRDVKPENILLSSGGRAVLADFNVAVAESGGAHEGLVGGTLSYMSPQELSRLAGLESEDAHNPGDNDAGVRADLFSLGIVLYELLTSELPYPVVEADQSIVAAAREALPARREALDRVRENPDLTGSLRSIVEACLATAGDRAEPCYESAGQVAEDLARYLDLRPLKHATERLSSRITRRLRRHRRIAMAASVILATAIGVVGTNLWAMYDALEHAESLADRMVRTPAAKLDDRLPPEIERVLFANGLRYETESYRRRRAELGSRIGKLHQRHKRLELAIPLLERAAELDPNSGSTWNNLGAARFDAGLPEQAIEAFNQSLRFESSPERVAIVLTNRALAHGILNRAGAARSDLEQALEVDADCEPALRYLRLLDEAETDNAQ